MNNRIGFELYVYEVRDDQKPEEGTNTAYPFALLNPSDYKPSELRRWWDTQLNTLTYDEIMKIKVSDDQGFEAQLSHLFDLRCNWDELLKPIVRDYKPQFFIRIFYNRERTTFNNIDEFVKYYGGYQSALGRVV